MKDRLSRLEAELRKAESVDIKSAVSTHGKTLARILGRTDALFWPHRLTKATRAIYQQQRQFRSLNGILWRSSGKSSTANWKSDERLRATLLGLGLINLNKTQTGLYVKLTEAAEAGVRQLCGLLFITAEIAGMVETYYRGLASKNGLIREDELFQFPYAENPDPADWLEHEEKVVSLLTQGWMTSRSSTIGHIYYRLSESPLVGLESVVGIEFCPEARKAYLETWTQEITHRESWEPLDCSEVFIPIPASF